MLNVVRAKSAEGLNPLSFELETIGLAIAASYGFLHNLAFSAFGESVVRPAPPLLVFFLLKYSTKSRVIVL